MTGGEKQRSEFRAETRAYVIDVNNRDRFPLMNPWAERKAGVEAGDQVEYCFSKASGDPFV